MNYQRRAPVIAMLWAVAKADPAATAPPQQADCIPAAIDPAATPTEVKPTTASTTTTID